MKLWLPEPTPQQYQPPPPPPPSSQNAQAERKPSRSPRKKTSRTGWGSRWLSSGRQGVPRRIGMLRGSKPLSNSARRARRNRRRGGWDAEEPAPDNAAQMALVPSRPALPPGQTGRPAGMHGPVPVNRFGIAEATPEALAAAVFRAQQVEKAGLEAMRDSGKIPRGPPDLPTGTEVIEQKCVAYLIGKGGQALAAINAAAGVSTQIDQSTKQFGYSMANIYGTEEGTAKAKLILRQKISEYRPLRG
eukprot:g26186.t1